jgi:hypothetical protein
MLLWIHHSHYIKKIYRLSSLVFHHFYGIIAVVFFTISKSTIITQKTASVNRYTIRRTPSSFWLYSNLPIYYIHRIHNNNQPTYTITPIFNTVNQSSLQIYFTAIIAIITYISTSINNILYPILSLFTTCSGCIFVL